jgi:hypothetical protein
MRRVVSLLASLGALAAAAGCELLVGIKDKSEASDASTGETSTGDASDEDPDGPCAKQPANLFCDDFDSEIEAGDGWTWDLSMAGGAVGFDTTDYVTKPRSALFTIPGAGTPSAQLGQNIGPDLQSGYRLSFDLRLDVDDLSSVPQLGVAQVYRTPQTDVLSFNYVVGPGATASVQLFEGTSQTMTILPLTQTPPTRTWTRIVMVYDATEGVTVIEDDRTIGSSTAAAHGPPGQTSVIVGAVYSNPGNPSASAVTFAIDDVVLRGE